MNDRVGFLVGEQLLHQLADVVESGTVLLDVLAGFLAEVGTNGKAPLVSIWVHCRKANEVVWDGFAVDAVDSGTELEFADCPRHEFFIGDIHLPWETVLESGILGEWLIDGHDVRL